MTAEELGQKLPAGHAEHTASEETVHALETNCPVHGLHVEHDAAFVVSENVEPAEQDGHTVSVVEVQTALLYFPAAHTVQVDGADEPERQKLPAGHAICADALGQ